MSYAKTDVVLYRIVWRTNTGDNIDLSPYLVSHSSEEGLSIENNKVSLSFKLVKDTDTDVGVLAPFFANSEGVSRLKTDSFLKVFIKYADGSEGININRNDDLVKTYYVTDWSVNEPSQLLNINAVDLAYKITNRVISKTYSIIDSGSPTNDPSGTDVMVDTGASFKVPGDADSFDDGLKWMTLELVDDTGEIYTYLITDNTSTTLTVHKNIESKTWVDYRVGWNSPNAFYDAFNRVGRSESGKGELFRNVKTERVTDVRGDYKNGIQFLRRDSSGSTWAFPIVDVGEAYFPVYRLVKEVSSYTACNTEAELLTRNPPVLRDMVFAVSWDETSQVFYANWFYVDVPEKGAVTLDVTGVNGDVITVNSGSVSDVGKLMRVKSLFTGSKIIYHSYNILAVSGNDYTVSGNADNDLVEVGDTVDIYGAIDFVWDNDQDFKHIYDLRLGASDEEKFNNIMFNAGTNQVAGRDILGHWFNERTESATLKDTFVPMTVISKNIMKHEREAGNIRLNDDVWEGWNGSAFDPNGNNWSFTTNFGVGNFDYVITSRTVFNQSFRSAARGKAYTIAEQIAVRQKENTLSGTIQVRGNRFVTAGSGGTISKWYQKGTRILFKRPQDALNNTGANYYLLTVNKIRHQIDSTSWVTFLDVEYDLFNTDELID